jgi:hypothetical protein
VNNGVFQAPAACVCDPSLPRNVTHAASCYLATMRVFFADVELVKSVLPGKLATRTYLPARSILAVRVQVPLPEARVMTQTVLVPAFTVTFPPGVPPC